MEVTELNVYMHLLIISLYIFTFRALLLQFALLEDSVKALHWVAICVLTPPPPFPLLFSYFLLIWFFKGLF